MNGNKLNVRWKGFNVKYDVMGSILYYIVNDIINYIYPAKIAIQHISWRVDEECEESE